MRKRVPYELYHITELVSDECFQNWVLFGKEEEFWGTWIRQHPEKQETVDAARQLLTMARLKSAAVSKDHVDIKWSQLKKQIQTRERQRAHPPSADKSRHWIPYAALLALVAGACWYGYLAWNEPEPVYYTTGYGEKREFNLPDGSRIRMNAHTQIAVPDWSNGRSVTLIQGEAFFEIAKTPEAADPGFTVHTGTVEVAVLGTQFNIHQNKESTRVLLTEGKINLSTADGTSRDMKPGELAQYARSGSLFISEEQPGAYLGWLTNELILDNITLKDLGEKIEEHFGKQVVIRNDQLKTKVLHGQVSDGDLTIILRVIESTLNIHATIQGEQILLY